MVDNKKQKRRSAAEIRNDDTLRHYTSFSVDGSGKKHSAAEIRQAAIEQGYLKQPEPTTARAVAPVNPVQNTSPIRDGLDIGAAYVAQNTIPMFGSTLSPGINKTLNLINQNSMNQQERQQRAYSFIASKLGDNQNPGMQDLEQIKKSIDEAKPGASASDNIVYQEAEKLLANWLNENSDSKRELVNNTPLNTMQKAVDGKNPISNDPFGDDSWLHDDKLIAQYLDPAKGSDKYNTEGVDYGTAGMGEYEFFTKYRDGAIPASEENQKRYEELKNRLTGYINNRPDQNTDTVLYTDEYGDKINTADAMRIKAQQNLLSDIKASPEQAASSLSELFTGNRKSENAVAVNSEELKNAGWNASGNSIINYVKPYSNYEYNNAAVFSPVVMGEDGSVQRILSPEELEQYASDVLSGKRGDNLGLQVTETFEGNFAASLAQENAKRIRRLSERQYAGTDVNGEVYGNDDKAVEDMGIDVGEAVQYQKLLRDKATNALLTKYYSDISTASLEDANIPDWLKNAMKPYAGMAATAANIAASPLQAVEYIQNLSEGAEGLFKSGGNKLSAYLLPNVANDYVTNLSNASTSAITEEIRSSIRGNGDSDFMNFLADTAANTYGGVSSGVQSTLVGLTCKALLPPGIAEAVSLSTMSLQAAQNTYNEQIKNGSPVGKATAYSVLTGLNEYIGEKVSLENLFSIVDSQGKKTAKQVFLQMFGQSAIEGSEEVNTSLLNAIADNLVNGDQAEYYQNIQKYREQGYSEEEAKEKATAEFLNGLISDAWGGAIGGLLGGGMGNIANTAQRNETANQAGQRVYQQGTIDELYKLAESMAEDKYVNNRLKSYDKVVQSYGNESAQAVKAAGDLYMAVQESNNTAVENSLTDERQKALEELYAKEIGADTSDASVTPAAKILNKYISGEKLTAKEQRVLSTDASQNTLKAYKNVSNDIYKKAMERQSKANANRTAANSLVAPKAKEYKADIDGYNVHTDDNKVYTADGSEQVDIEDIASVGKNDIQVVTSKGDTVSIKSLDMPEKTAMLYRAALDIQKDLGVDLPPAIVSEIVNGYGDLNSDVSMSNYVIETAHAIANGYTNNNAAYNAKTSVLSESAYKAFYEQGRKLAASHTKAQQRAVSARIKGAQTRTESKVRFTDGLTQDSRTGSVYYSEDGKTYKGIGKAKQTGVDLMTKLAKALGFDVVFYRSTQTKKKGPYTSKYVTENNFAPKGADAPNGFWRNGTMYIDINAGMNGEGIILYTASHELVHMIREGSPEHFKALADFLVENYAEAGTNVDDLVRDQMRENTKLNYDEAYEEVIARACEDFLRDTHINEKAKALYQQDRTLWEKIRDALKKILDSLKELMEKGGLYEKGSQSEAARLTAQMGYKIVEQAHDLWIEGIQASAENLRNMNKAADNGGAKLQARSGSGAFNENAVSTAIWEALDHADNGNDNLIKVSSMPHYVESLLGIGGDFYVQRNHTYENTVDEEQAKAEGRYDPKAHYHAYGVEKMERALSAIEHPIMTIVAPRTNDRNPTVIMILDEFGNNGAPLYAVLSFYSNKMINGRNDIKPHVVLTIAEREWFAKEGRTGYDEIINNAIQDDRVIDFDKNKKDDLTEVAQTTRLGSITVSSLEHNLSQFKKEINSFKEKNKISYQSRTDSSYLSAVNRGDMETAQRMVDEAAKEAGYTIKAYHGTPNGTFTVFKGWQYFTQNKEYADIYQNQGASSNGYKLTANKPYTYGVYLSTDNVFDTRQKKCRDIFMKEFYRKWGNGAPLSEKGLPDWTDGDDLVEFFEENDYDFDAILLDEGATGGYGDEVKSRGISYVIKDSSQIKSADPVTYDDKGNVIPLSERFNLEQKDIRYQSRDNRYLSAVKSGNMQEAQSLVDEAAKEAGYNTPMLYHGTQKFGFTKFDLNKMDDKMSIFLTSTPETASTYSGLTGKRGISEKYFNKNLFDMSAKELVKTANQFINEREKGRDIEYRYYTKNDLLKMADEVQDGLSRLKDVAKEVGAEYANKAMRDFDDSALRIHTIINNMLEDIKNGESYNWIGSAINQLANETDEFNTPEFKKLSDTLLVLGEIQDSRILRAGEEEAILRVRPDLLLYEYESNVRVAHELQKKMSSGNYATYAKLDNPLIIDAKGARWNQIPITDQIWDSLTMLQKGWNKQGNKISYTRSIAEYAKEHGYDGVVFKNLEDNGGKNDLVHTAKSDVYVVFDSTQVKSADPITYDDNGEVIPLSERFDSTKKDIRYQPRGGDIFDIDLFDDDSVENIFAREYATHHEDIGEVLRKISDIELAPAKVSSIVNRVLRNNLGMLDAETRRTLSTELQLALENVDRTDPEAVSNEMIAAVRKAIDNAEITDEHNTDNYNDLRNAFKGKTYYLTDEQIADLEENDMTLNDFKKAMFGKINIAKKGNATRALSLEGLHDNLTYPDEYLPFNREQWDEYGYHAPIILMETFENLSNSRTAPISEMMSSEEMDDMAVNLTAKMTGAIVEAKYNSKQNPYVSKLVSDLRQKRNEAVKAQREKNKQKLQDLREKERERAKKRELELREEYRERRAANYENRKRTEFRNKIRRIADSLSTRLTKPKGSHFVPQSLIAQTVDVLNSIDLDSGRSTRLSDKLEKLKIEYDKLAKDNEASAVYDSVISDMLLNLHEELGDTPIMKMSLNQLQQAYDVLKAMSEAITDDIKMVDTQFKKDCHTLGREMIAEIRAIKKPRVGLFEGWAMSMLRPDVFFDRMAGYKKNSTWSQMGRMLNDGQLRMTQLQMEFSMIFDDLIKDTKQLRRLFSTNKKNMVDLGLVDDDGNTVKITRGMMLSLYMHLLNEDNARHVLGGGLTVPGMKAYYKGDIKKAFGHDVKAVRAGDVDFTKYVQGLKSKIDAEMTVYEREWIEAAHEFFDVASRNALNETTMKLYGFNKAKVNNYFPIHTNPNYRTAKFEDIVRDMSLENSGFMKERVKASNPILLEDITDVINDQINKVSKYCGLTIPLRNFQKVYSTVTKGYKSSLQEEVDKKFSGSEKNSGAKKYIDNLLTDLTGGRRGGDGPKSNAFAKARGHLAQATLTLNPRVAIAQAASYPTAAAVIGWKPLIKAMSKGLSSADRAEIAEITPLLWYRTQGYSSVEIGDVKDIRKQKHAAQSKFKKALGWIEFFDSATVGRLYYACKYYVNDKFKELKPGTEEYKQKVAEVYNDVIEKTQPNYTTMQRPDILRNPNALVKSLTMFMTQRLQNFNIIYDAVGTLHKYRSDFKAGINDVTAQDVKHAWGKAYQAVSSQLAAAGIIVAMKLLADALTHSMDGYRDKDKELIAESITVTLLWNFGDTIFGNVLFASDIFKIIKSMATGERYYGVSLSGVDSLIDTLTDLTNLGTNVVQTFKGEKQLNPEYFKKLGKDICQVLGIPASNAEKLGKAIYYHVSDFSSGNGLSFEAGVKRSVKQNIHRIENLYSNGMTDDAKAILQDLINEKMSAGKTEKEAKSALRSSMTTLYRQRYIDAVNSNNSEEIKYIRKLLYFTGLYGTLSEQDKALANWVKDANK